MVSVNSFSVSSDVAELIYQVINPIIEK